MTTTPQELKSPNEIWLQLGYGDEGQHTWCDHEIEWEPQVKYTRCAAEPVDAGELDAAILALEEFQEFHQEETAEDLLKCAPFLMNIAKAHRANLSNVTPKPPNDETTQSFWHEPPKGGIVEVVINWNERQYNVQSFSKSAWKHKHNPTAQAKDE